MLEFATILERKSRSLLKTKFMMYINKRNDDFSMTELQNKYKKFQTEFDQMTKTQEKFLGEKEKEITDKNDQS